MTQLEHITPEQIAQYGVVAAPDRLTGKAQDNKAIFDRLVRELVALVVNDIIDKANDLLVAEDDRAAAEAIRVEAEKLRVQAEATRIENEQSRVQAEARRVSAELLRVQAENLRASAEEARVTAETAREEAEARRESTTEGIVVRATEQAEAAERSATHALNAEQGASYSERSAGESAESARQSADNASQSAQSAGVSAGVAQNSANAAEEAAKHYPYIDPIKRTWFVWDVNAGTFVDTGIKGEATNSVAADGLWGVHVNEEGYLVVIYTGDDPPPLSISEDGYLVYTLAGQEIQIGKVSGSGGGSGADGGYYIPFVDKNGDLSWTATKLDMPEVPTTNIKGPGVPSATGIPDGYTLQTMGGEAVWGESAGGSGEMELINSMTLDQAVTSGRIDVDTTGQPFVLSEAIATVKLPKGEMLNNPVYYWYFTADTKFYVNRSIGNGNEFSLIAEGNASIGYIKLYYTSVYSGTSGIYANLVEVNQNITMFRFANFDGVPLPAGTAISLYGKRKAV